MQSSDMKKWGTFVAFLFVLFIVLIFALQPGGESEARSLMAEAEALNRRAQANAERTQTPQDLANLDLSNEALRKAKLAMVESDYSAAMEEARKSLLHARKVAEREAPTVQRRGRIRVGELAGEVQVKKRFSANYEAADLTTPLDLGDTVRTGVNGGVVMGISGKLDIRLLGISELSFPDLQSSEGIKDLFLESGEVGVRALEPVRRPTVRTNAGDVIIFPGSQAWVRYDAGVGRLRVRVATGRAEVRAAGGAADVLRNQQISLNNGQPPSSPLPLPASPELQSPDDFSKYDANQNGFAAVDFQWANSPTGRYRFEISTDSLFTTLAYQQEIPRTNINLPDLRIGGYYWRVLALDRNGQVGLATAVRQLEVVRTSGSSSTSVVDETPPNLEIFQDKTIVQGYVAIIRGRTERGAKVSVEGEPAFVDDETGEFQYTLNFPGKGIYTLNVVSVDRVGNRAFDQIKIEIRD